ncbi:MAG TPA: 3-phosphoglycerate dehydrogenase, partial [Methylomirabilota bacterium]|nr:3-phosphoglycerate dehydrogenase [Methylomirabilota bacterium]
MPRPRLLVADPLSEATLGLLTGLADVHYWPDRPEDEILARLPGCQVLVLRSGHRVTGRWFEVGRDLRGVIRAGVGTDNIDVEAARRRGVRVATIPTAATASVAELAIAAMLLLMRRLVEGVRTLAAGTWCKADLLGWELSG